MSKLMTQKFNSVNEIDPEFIAPLEGLLAENIPSFEYIKNSEKLADENIKFNYYLFFGHQTNAPIGFAQIKLVKDAPKKGSIIKKLNPFKKIPREVNENSALWNIPGARKEGIVFNPKYSNYVGEKTTEVFTDILEREDVYKEKIYFSEIYSKSLSSQKIPMTITPSEETVIDFLLKNKSSYQEYLSGLTKDFHKDIIQTWKFVQRELGFKMGEYNTLKEVFHYKDKGVQQHKEVMSHKKIGLYNFDETEITYLTFETAYEVKSLALYIKGKNSYAFYDTIIFDETLPELIPHQQVLNHFFEQNGENHLYYLGEDLEKDYLLKLGFGQRKQLSYSAQKVEI